MNVSYILPLRSEAVDEQALTELTSYLRGLSCLVAEIVVVDGSPDAVFRRHGRVWSSFVRHIPPDPSLRFLNGKVGSVTTGMAMASLDRVIVADDDVRYEAEALRRTADLLCDADLVRPQNYFQPLPWHARWDTARMLINRAIGSDFPGTLGVRRSSFLAMGGYDGDVLFENLELIRTVKASGGTACSPRDLFVRRIPPSARRFLSQRIRQAYDDLARPFRMTVVLLIAPAIVTAIARRRLGLIAAAALASVGLAEAGRRRGGGREIFPGGSAWLAPAWVLERAICAWLAVALRMSVGGCRYRGTVIRVPANSVRTIRGRLGTRPWAATPARRSRSIAQSGLER